VSPASSASTQTASTAAAQPASTAAAAPVIAPTGVTSLKCPSCGAPISPKFGEMIITCEYCGSSVTLGNAGWTNIQKQTMLPVKVATVDAVNAIIHPLMDKGLLHRHLQEDSTQEEMTLSYVPYWIVSISARTSVVATSIAMQTAQTATTAALLGVMLGGGGFGGGGGYRGGGGGRRRAYSMVPGDMNFIPRSMISMVGFGMGGMGYGGGGQRQAEQMNANYNFPVVALKALTAYQPKEYQFDLQGRVLFDITKIPKSIKVLNGDIGEDAAKAQAKTLVDQLQSQKAHEKYHMIQKIDTQMDVGESELLHAPIWFVKYDHKGNKIILVVDANSGLVINSLGLD
jgi:DNA-directed RNA polymerase subunit RPC12/RpoP